MKLFKLLAKLFSRRKIIYNLIPISIEDNCAFYFEFLKFPDQPRTWKPYYRYWELCEAQQPELLTDLEGKLIKEISFKLGEYEAIFLFEEFN
jgi:hypothetical protein